MSPNENNKWVYTRDVERYPTPLLFVSQWKTLDFLEMQLTLVV
jgi:hypothetical protein